MLPLAELLLDGSHGSSMALSRAGSRFTRGRRRLGGSDLLCCLSFRAKPYESSASLRVAARGRSESEIAAARRMLWRSPLNKFLTALVDLALARAKHTVPTGFSLVPLDGRALSPTCARR